VAIGPDGTEADAARRFDKRYTADDLGFRVARLL
jgi:hypothetical protein